MAKVTKIPETRIGHRKGKGAPPGNKNAVKHGFYSKALHEAERISLQEAVEVEGVDEEIALLRCKLAELVQNFPDRIDLQIQTASAIARLVRTRYQISKEQKRSLKEAIAKVLAEVAAPLGVGVGMGISMKVK
jgi:hypothetical protein